MKIKVNGKNLSVGRIIKHHGWVELLLGNHSAQVTVNIPEHVYINGGSVFTSGNRIEIKKGLK
jgi:hypothetical protein